MSLIEEALRKQREENEKPGSATVPSPPAPAVPPPLPPELPLEEEPARRSWTLLAGIVGGGALAILFIFWLLVFGLKLWQAKPDLTIIKTVISTNNTPLASPAHQSKITINEAVKSPPQPPTTAVQPTTPPPPVTLPPPATIQPSVPKAQELPLSTTPVAEKTPSYQKSSNPAPTPAKLELPILWPKIMVSGIIGSSKNGRSAAILNGQMLSPGETIEGVTIESIDKQKVKLRYNEEIKLLSVGASTE